MIIYGLKFSILQRSQCHNYLALKSLFSSANSHILVIQSLRMALVYLVCSIIEQYDICWKVGFCHLIQNFHLFSCFWLPLSQLLKQQKLLCFLLFGIILLQETLLNSFQQKVNLLSRTMCLFWRLNFQNSQVFFSQLDACNLYHNHQGLVLASMVDLLVSLTWT